MFNVKGKGPETTVITVGLDIDTTPHDITKQFLNVNLYMQL